MQNTSSYHNPDENESDEMAGDINLASSDDKPAEGDWSDEEDEDFDDEAESRNDLNEIRVGDDLGKPSPEDDDHLPDDDLQ